MAAYDFLGTADALARNVDKFDKWDGIQGLRGIVADRLSHPPTRTRSGMARKPEQPGTTYADRDKFKVITRVERRNGDEYGPGMCAVVFEDGTEDLFDHQDLLCVEIPIPSPVRHYGADRTACGNPLEELDAITEDVKGITCRGCNNAVHKSV